MGYDAVMNIEGNFINAYCLPSLNGHYLFIPTKNYVRSLYNRHRILQNRIEMGSSIYVLFTVLIGHLVAAKEVGSPPRTSTLHWKRDWQHACRFPFLLFNYTE